MFPEAGGSSSFARHAFNEVASFFAGWALTLDYIITVAISAFFVPHYLGAFWPALKHNPGDIIGGAVTIACPRRAEHPRPQGVGEAEHLPRGHRPRHPGAADRAGRRADLRPVGADRPDPPRHGADVQGADLRPVDLDGGLHRHRDGLEHGGGGARPGARRADDGQLRPDRGARHLRRHLDHLARRAPGHPRRGRPLLHPARHHLRERPGARDRHAPRPRPRARDGAPLLRRRAGRDDSRDRDERRPDRDLTPVVVARGAPPAPRHLRAPAPPLPDALVHDRVLLGHRDRAAHPGADRLPRQPLQLRRDALVHDRARLDRRAALPAAGQGTPVPSAVERALQGG